MVSPIVIATTQSAVLAAISNAVAQVLQCWNENIPFALNPTELFHFTLYAVLSCPPNFIWQAWLEAQFPGYTGDLGPRGKEKLVDEVVTGQSTGIDEKSGENAGSRRVASRPIKDDVDPTRAPPSSRRLNIKNTAIKFSLDNTLGAGVNNLMFIVGLGLLRSQSVAEIRRDVDEQFWTMIFAGQKVWPAVSILSFVAIPVQHRTTFGAIIGLFWGIYLSILTSQRT